MSVLSICPHCGAKHKLPDDSKVGKKLRCRECEEPFVVKAAKAQTAQSQGAKRPARSRVAAAPGGLPPRVNLKAKPKKKKAQAADEAGKKKSRKKSRSRSGKNPAMVGGVSVLILALLGGLWLQTSGTSEPMQAPASYATFTHSVNSEFKIEYPDGWEVDSGGTQGKPVWAKFSQGDIKIRVRSSMGASAMGDIARSMNTMSGTSPDEIPEELAPVAQVHEHMHDQFADEYSDYKENPPVKIETGFGDSRVSEFTASGSFGSTIRGMRASMLGMNLQFTVICECPEEDWDVCRAIFDRAIKSMSRG